MRSKHILVKKSDLTITYKTLKYLASFASLMYSLNQSHVSTQLSGTKATNVPLSELLLFHVEPWTCIRLHFSAPLSGSVATMLWLWIYVPNQPGSLCSMLSKHVMWNFPSPLKGYKQSALFFVLGMGSRILRRNSGEIALKVVFSRCSSVPLSLSWWLPRTLSPCPSLISMSQREFFPSF